MRLFATCPPSSAHPDGYRERVAEVARWSERAGCEGILVYTDNSLLDPWLVAQLVLDATETLAPLVAIQPVYMHPYAVAKMVASLARLYGRPVHLNLVSGGFRNDLLALGDSTPHDRRYERLTEYATIVQGLLAGGPVTLEGAFYRVERLKLAPAPPPELRGDVFVSGSSAAGLGAARALGALAVRYPRPAAEEVGFPGGDVRTGLRLGIVARDEDEAAWRAAAERFPADRRGQLTHQLAMKVSDSVWHRQLSELAGRTNGSPYWLFPFENYKTMCPYLVGSYRRVGEELGRYLELGARTFILDVPPDEEELGHVVAAFEAATLERAAS
ncbi:MAG TPA: LLM class flavin-dependent oxidoreductase [Thermoanaerobaculia bacterium]|nr:LLM class flavin-dependent oxidoreductase [Thermoanaerobaculia bacterium]